MKSSIFIFFLLGINISLNGQVKPPEPVFPIPTKQQWEWHQMEMNAFIHFSINTFTDKEWGYGDESAQIFNPTEMNADQWIWVLKENNFKGVIITAKHHDGFCLWPSRYTLHSVKSSPYLSGKGDVVRDVALAARKYQLKFGIYLSPWDRNRQDYGTPDYITYYRNQLHELLTNYGPVFEMWFDGANGGEGYYGGTNGLRLVDKKVYYKWPETLEMAHKIQPDMLFFSDAGPDIRWLGNERAVAGETNWNTISNDTLYAGKAGIGELLSTGSENGTKWIPAEADVSIRPGWFYHSSEDSLVKTPEQLFDIYLTSVGRGAVLLLNVPPDRRGLIAQEDQEALRGFTELLKQRLGINLAANADIVASNVRGKDKRFMPEMMLDDNAETYWCTDDGIKAGEVEIRLGRQEVLNYISIGEYLPLGQRVRSFEVDLWESGRWNVVARGTTIGYKRILPLDGHKTDKIRIKILDSKACPVINTVKIF
ncbi:MAG: alpha-L-fucosidase [Saprospiraceae bacterium]|nr:alpha-L-fucosidase [Saprospiraceae bacterium]